MKAFYEVRDERVYIGGMTRYPYPLHVHDVVELSCVLRGDCDIQLDGHAYTLHPGDIAVAFPLVPHRYQGDASRSYSGYDRGHQLPSADRLCSGW